MHLTVYHTIFALNAQLCSDARSSSSPCLSWHCIFLVIQLAVPSMLGLLDCYNYGGQAKNDEQSALLAERTAALERVQVENARLKAAARQARSTPVVDSDTDERLRQLAEVRVACARWCVHAFVACVLLAHFGTCICMRQCARACVPVPMPMPMPMAMAMLCRAVHACMRARL